MDLGADVTIAKKMFQRDKEQLLVMLREIGRHLAAKKPARGHFLGIDTACRRMTELLLAERFGYVQSPLQCVSHELGTHSARRSIVWCEPTGETGEYSTSVADTDVRLGGTGPLPQRARDIAVDLGGLVDRWIAAVDALKQPAPYPNLPWGVLPGGDPVLCRDPLWRTLDGAAKTVFAKDLVPHANWAHGNGPPWRNRLEALMDYEGLGEGYITSIQTRRGGVQDGLSARGPDGQVAVLPFGPGGTLATEQLLELQSKLNEWRQERANQLLPAAVSAARRRRRGVQQKRGPKHKYDSKADLKYYRDYRASGMGKVAFDQKRGEDAGTVTKVYNRLKKRGLHK